MEIASRKNLRVLRLQGSPRSALRLAVDEKLTAWQRVVGRAAILCSLGHFAALGRQTAGEKQVKGNSAATQLRSWSECIRQQTIRLIQIRPATGTILLLTRQGPGVIRRDKPCNRLKGPSVQPLYSVALSYKMSRDQKDANAQLGHFLDLIEFRLYWSSKPVKGVNRRCQSSMTIFEPNQRDLANRLKDDSRKRSFASIRFVSARTKREPRTRQEGRAPASLLHVH